MKIKKSNTKLKDGLYAVKNGEAVKLDSFTWGYEGLCPIKHAAVEIYDDEVVLVAGPGHIGDTVLQFDK